MKETKKEVKTISGRVPRHQSPFIPVAPVYQLSLPPSLPPAYPVQIMYPHATVYHHQPQPINPLTNYHPQYRPQENLPRNSNETPCNFTPLLEPLS